MLNMYFVNRSSMNILCLGAHCDDIEIGCGGAILKYSQIIKNINVYWVVFSSDNNRRTEAIHSAEDFLKNVNNKNIVVNQFRNSYFPDCWGEIKEYFEDKIKSSFTPDLIFTHCRGDLHQDHRVINELTWNSFRNHLILEYEIAKYDADLGSPNTFVGLDESICKKKIEYILNNFKSQSDKPWFTEDLFMSIMRLRGVESNSPGRYAEAFYCRKIII
ncbi:MAG: PIG-L family deacetylase [Deltaproteobacteria bacterium]|nr:PIG-L family deacetylase [Deltaproteobacteria bacterium]